VLLLRSSSVKLKCTLCAGNPSAHADATRLILEDKFRC
jgi:hypothetical protein